MEKPPASSAGQRDVKWADGLRGLAAVFVVITHIKTGFVPPFSNGLPTWYKLPLIRSTWEGDTWVTFFFLLTSYVNCIKPLKQARAGQHEAALMGLASSTFRRVWRLVLPCTVATVFSWVICELRLYDGGKAVGNDWLRNTSPHSAGSVVKAVSSLFKAMWRTWTHGTNAYDENQWTMMWFLRASMLLFVALLATLRASPKWRSVIMVGLCVMSWATKQLTQGIDVYAGVLIAELSLLPDIGDLCSHRASTRWIPTILCILSIFMISYPSAKIEEFGWAAPLHTLGDYIFPRNTDFSKFWHTIGANVMTVAILLSPHMRRVLSLPVLTWLGQISFPLYLLHGPLLRSFMKWSFYLLAPVKSVTGQDGQETSKKQRPALWQWLYTLPLFWVVLLYLSNAWNNHLEPLFGRITKKAEDVVCERGSAPAVLPVQMNGFTDQSLRPTD